MDTNLSVLYIAFIMVEVESRICQMGIIFHSNLVFYGLIFSSFFRVSITSFLYSVPRENLYGGIHWRQYCMMFCIVYPRSLCICQNKKGKGLCNPLDFSLDSYIPSSLCHIVVIFRKAHNNFAWLESQFGS